MNEVTIQSFYYFHLHHSYVCTAWGQNLNPKHHKFTTEESYANN